MMERSLTTCEMSERVRIVVTDRGSDQAFVEASASSCPVFRGGPTQMITRNPSHVINTVERNDTTRRTATRSSKPRSGALLSMMNLRVNILNSPITRIKMAESGKGMGTITSTTGINTHTARG